MGGDASPPSPLLIPRIASLDSLGDSSSFAFSPTTNLFPGYTRIQFITSDLLLIEFSIFLFFLSVHPLFFLGGGGRGDGFW